MRRSAAGIVASGIVGLAFVLLCGVAAGQDGLDMAHVQKLRDEGKKLFDEAANMDLSLGERNRLRKESYTLLTEAWTIVDKWLEAHPGDVERYEDLMVELGQMRYWLRKESPVGLLEGDANVRRGKPPSWPDKPPEDAPSPGPAKPPAASTPAAPPPPAVDPMAEHLAYAAEYEKQHPFDLPGIHELYLSILDHAAPGSEPYVLALRKVSDLSSRMKAHYRTLRNEDPDSLDLEGPEERRILAALAKDLKSRNADERLRAAEYMGRLGSGHAARHLVPQLLREKETRVVDMIFTALGQIGGAKVMRELTDLRKKDDAALMGRALDLLGEFMNRSEVEARYAAQMMGEFVFADDPAIVGRALDKLEGLGAKGTIGLVNAIGVRDHATKLRVIAALGKTGDGRAAAGLNRFLIYAAKGPLLAYRNAAVESLMQIGVPAVPYLARDIDTPQLRQHVKHVLWKITGESFDHASQVAAWWRANGGGDK